ncbi:hypothetical protein C4D60_Mb06t04840 [Musa balbisiana]|uniref:Uncharacterized protein n=1 Tax=Musa balbisiana TaxID=52838 RepID=A0A4S8ILD1_MUSBA|nr:hypothetical protein C4D60_Mb06t04840 [Musa balbisiana]
MNYYVCVLFLSKVTEDLVVYFGLQCCSDRGTLAKKVERLHEWGLHDAFISASSSIITGLQLPPQSSNCRRRILEYQKQ